MRPYRVRATPFAHGKIPASVNAALTSVSYCQGVIEAVPVNSQPEKSPPMSRYLTAFLAAAFVAVPAASDALADGSGSAPCGKRDDLLSHLSQKYSEKPVAMGLATNGSVVEVLSSKDSGSFTIVYTMPNGMTCLMAAGSNWEFTKAKGGETKT